MGHGGIVGELSAEELARALETRLVCAGVWEVPRPRAPFPAGPGGGELVGEAGGAMQMGTCGLAMFSGASSL